MGKQQQFELGQWTRKRYHNFLNNTLHLSDVYVRSSDVDRTIMSAESNLAGLYPPMGKQIWNEHLPWQPISVHTFPANIDYITGGAVPPCPAFENAYKAYLQSAETKKFDQSIQPIYDYLSLNLNTTVKDYITVLMVYDSLFIQNIYNLK